MKILALETSTEYCSVALWQDGITVECCERVGQKHSELLIAMIASLLGDEGVSLSQMDGIAFGSGPGSFTGVRIACGVAQGLALGTNLSVAGICTLLALAEGAGHPKVITALDARMGEIYFAAYEKSADVWTTVCEPCLCKPDDAPQLAGENWFGAGSGFADQTLQVRYAHQLQGMDADAVPRAAMIAGLGAGVFARGEGADAALAQPLYLRDKVALKTVEREQLAADKLLNHP